MVHSEPPAIYQLPSEVFLPIMAPEAPLGRFIRL